MVYLYKMFNYHTVSKKHALENEKYVEKRTELYYRINLALVHMILCTYQCDAPVGGGGATQGILTGVV